MAAPYLALAGCSRSLLPRGDGVEAAGRSVCGVEGGLGGAALTFFLGVVALTTLAMSRAEPGSRIAADTAPIGISGFSIMPAYPSNEN